MTKLTWGTTGERYFETGIDHGVLYVDEVGYAWNGLTSVAEAPTGGTALSYYVDGQKYLNVVSAEEFVATINAFSAPAEFAECDGTKSIHNGLFATQQKRKPFGFSYRSKIGNDTEGLEFGYKIHIVYDALAAPSSRNNSTQNDSTSPTALSWTVNTLPQDVPGGKPTAHFVVDTRFTPRGLVSHIEDILYGDADTAARLLPASELIELFTMPAPVVARNLYTNPSFENSIGVTAIRRNYFQHPRMSITGMLGWINERTGVTASPASDGLELLQTGTGTGTWLFHPSAASRPSSSSGDTWSILWTIENTGPVSVVLAAQLRNTTLAQQIVGESIVIKPGETKQLYLENWASGAGYIQGDVRAVNLPDTAKIVIKDMPLLERASKIGAPFDGSHSPVLRENLFRKEYQIFTSPYTTSAVTVNVENETMIVTPNGTGNWFVQAGGYPTSSFYHQIQPGNKYRVLIDSNVVLGFQIVCYIGASHTVVNPDSNGVFEIPLNATGGGAVRFTSSGPDVAVLSKPTLVLDSDETDAPFTGNDGISNGLVYEWKDESAFSSAVAYDMDYTPSWLGSVNESISQLTVMLPKPPSEGDLQGGGALSYLSSRSGVLVGSKSLRITPLTTGTTAHYQISSYNPLLFKPGLTYTAIAAITLLKPLSGVLYVYALSLVSTDSINSNHNTKDTAPNEVGTHYLRTTFTVPLGATWSVLRLFNGASMGNGDVWWDKVGFFEGEYIGDHFDGDTPDANYVVYEWEGEPHDSTSIARSWNPI